MCIPPQIFHPVNERQLLSADCQSQQKYDTSAILDTNSLLSVTTYHREKNTRYTHFGPELSSPIRHSLSSPFPRPPKSHLGALRNIPLELLYLIIQDLDIHTIFNLRHANLRFREVVTSFPLYNRLASHAIDTLLACNRLGLSPNLTLSTLHSALTTDVCHICGEFGPYLFMPTLQRCCNRCIEDSARLGSGIKAVRLTNAQRKFYARYEDGSSFRILRSVPEAYPKNIRVSRNKALGRRMWLVAENRLPKIEGAGLKIPPAKKEEDDRIRYDLTYMSCVAVPPLEVNGGEVRVQKGVSCKGCKETWGRESARALTAGHIPFCGSPAKGMEQRLYSRRGFMEHIVWCKKAQAVWEAAAMDRSTVELARAVVAENRRGPVGNLSRGECDAGLGVSVARFIQSDYRQ